MKSLFLHFLCVISVTLTVFCANAKEINLATNGDFESEIDNKSFWKLNKGAVQVRDEAFKGKKAVRITRMTPEGHIRYSLLSDFIPYNDSVVKVSAWWKGKNITQGKKSWHVALFHIYFFDKNKKTIGRHSSVGSLKGDSNWTQNKRTYHPYFAKKISGTLFPKELSI